MAPINAQLKLSKKSGRSHRCPDCPVYSKISKSFRWESFGSSDILTHDQLFWMVFALNLYCVASPNCKIGFSSSGLRHVSVIHAMEPKWSNVHLVNKEIHVKSWPTAYWHIFFTFLPLFFVLLCLPVVAVLTSFSGMCVFWDARPGPVCYSPCSSVPCGGDCKGLPGDAKRCQASVASVALSDPACECRSLTCVNQTSAKSSRIFGPNANQNKSNMFPLHSVSICCAWAFGSLRMVQVKRNFKTIQNQLAVSSTGWLSHRNSQGWSLLKLGEIHFGDRIGDTGIPKMLQDCKEVAETSSWKKLRGSNYVNQVYHNHTIWQQLQDFRVGYRHRLAFGK